MHNLVRGGEGGQWGGGGGSGECGCKQGLLWEMCTSTFFHKHCLQMKAVKTALRFKFIILNLKFINFVLAPVDFAD